MFFQSVGFRVGDLESVNPSQEFPAPEFGEFGVRGPE